jgi:hypothetical protein
MTEPLPVMPEVVAARRALRCLYLEVHPNIADDVTARVDAAFAAMDLALYESVNSGVLQAVLDAIAGTLDGSTEIADHPNVKFATYERLKLTEQIAEQLAALKATYAYWQQTGFADCDPDCDCIVQQVEAAIANAEPEQR